MSEIKSNVSLNIGGKTKAPSFQAVLPEDRLRRKGESILRYDNYKFIQYSESSYGYGILVGVAKYNGEIAFAIINKDLTLTYVSVTTPYTLLGDIIPSNLSVLNYIWKNDRKALCEKCKALMEKTVDEVIVPIKIPEEADRPFKRNFKKFNKKRQDKKPAQK